MEKQKGVELFEARKDWLRNVNLTSDMFASVVFEDRLALQDVLRILTGIRELNVRKVVPQKSIRNLYGHANVLDVWAEDRRGHQYNIELQMSENEDHLKRNRYIQSQIDTRIFAGGKKYSEIPDVYLIFITRKDFLKIHTGMTEVLRILAKNSRRLDNGVHEIYANLEYPAEREEVTRLLDFFKDTNKPEVDDRGFEHLTDRVYELKYEKQGVRYMCEWSEWERAEGKIEGKIACIFELLEENGEIPENLREKIESQKDVDVLSKWLKMAAKAATVEEFEESLAVCRN